VKQLIACALLLASPAAADDFLRIEAGGTVLAFPAEAVVEVTPSGAAATPTIRVRLDPAHDAAFAALTAGAVGSELVILVCGREVSRPRLMEPLSAADFMLSLPPDPPEARRILALLQAKSC
jgi:preprotein translocase subunit SecD